MFELFKNFIAQLCPFIGMSASLAAAFINLWMSVTRDTRQVSAEWRQASVQVCVHEIRCERKTD